MLDLGPTRRKLRQFGAVAVLAFGLAGLELGESSASVRVALWGIAAIAGLFALVWPPGNRPLYVALSLASFPVSFVVSHVVLAALFYGLLTPIGLLLRLLGRDPLERRFRPELASYWRELPEVTDDEDYFRQF